MTAQAAQTAIRPANADDCSSLAALSLEVWCGTYLQNGINSHFADYVLSQYTPAHFAAALQNPAERLLVSQNLDGIDGYIRLAHGQPNPVDSQSRTEIMTLYVQPRHQGNGTGLRLLQAGLQLCRDNNWDAPWLASNSDNTSAISFYLRNGFEHAGLTHFRIGDSHYPNDVLRFRNP
ncbi:GNAT family N-acetyltransferase [Leisingera daeponensis]|uniref:GNAT family N-acetyltransferase n=1 Tax=Leisingera daeponensis TaxID=405746 RepID=UPI001C95616A|nr:GNAT family N-acetyltransferase [Leisingera daeponensis]MBY6056307.1 GNAT family N-acetyltransferase [Leisingera daeponensis]